MLIEALVGESAIVVSIPAPALSKLPWRKSSDCTFSGARFLNAAVLSQAILHCEYAPETYSKECV